jgi:hypothetical protein
MGQPAFRKNPKTGRLEKLINGKYTAQKSAGFWDWDSKEGKKRNRNNPLRIIRDTIRNVNYEKKRRNKLESKNSSKPTSKPTNKNRSKLTFSQGAKAIESAKKGSTTKSKPKPAVGNEAEIAKLRKRIKSGGMSMKRGQLKGRLEKRIRKLQQANKGSGSKGDFGKGTYGKGLPSNPQLKTQTTKDKRDPNRHAIKIAPKDLPKDKVKMKDGSIVDRSSLYEKKKKENVPLGTRLSKMFD